MYCLCCHFAPELSGHALILIAASLRGGGGWYDFNTAETHTPSSPRREWNGATGISAYPLTSALGVCALGTVDSSMMGSSGAGWNSQRNVSPLIGHTHTPFPFIVRGSSYRQMLWSNNSAHSYGTLYLKPTSK